MKDNGLKYSKLKTTSTPIIIQSDLDILANVREGAWFIAYLYHRVVIGKIKNGKFEYYPDTKIPNDVSITNILKLRVFDEDTELFVWKTKLRGYKARFRTDGIGPGQGVVDANQVLFGTEAKKIGNTFFSALTEKRGTEIILSLSDLGIDESEIDDKKGRLCVHTRSYIGSIANTGQATYEDVRFIKFEIYKEEKK